MINPNSISLHSRQVPEDRETDTPGYTQWMASLQLTTDHRMTDLEMQELAPDELKAIVQDIENRLRSAIWHHVYGDLEQPIMELIMYAKRHQPQGVVDLQLQTLTDNIITMLTPGIDKG